jgi:hypothetical protein
VIDENGEQHTISISDEDLGDVEWDDLFDWLVDWAEKYDVDYDNEYQET